MKNKYYINYVDSHNSKRIVTRGFKSLVAFIPVLLSIIRHTNDKNVLRVWFKKNEKK